MRLHVPYVQPWMTKDETTIKTHLKYGCGRVPSHEMQYISRTSLSKILWVLVRNSKNIKAIVPLNALKGTLMTTQQNLDALKGTLITTQQNLTIVHLHLWICFIAMFKSIFFLFVWSFEECADPMPCDLEFWCCMKAVYTQSWICLKRTLVVSVMFSCVSAHNWFENVCWEVPKARWSNSCVQHTQSSFVAFWSRGKGPTLSTLCKRHLPSLHPSCQDGTSTDYDIQQFIKNGWIIRWPSGSKREFWWFARIASQRKTIFIQCSSDSLESPQTCDSQSLVPQNWREGDPPKKPPTQKKTVCTNSLRKLFCLFSAYLKGKRGDNLYRLSRNCLRKLFVQTVFIWVGGFFGWVFPSWKTRRRRDDFRESLDSRKSANRFVRIGPSIRLSLNYLRHSTSLVLKRICHFGTNCHFSLYGTNLSKTLAFLFLWNLSLSCWLFTNHKEE